MNFIERFGGWTVLMKSQASTEELYLNNDEHDVRTE